MPAAELSRVLYRSLLRWAKEAEGVPFTLRPHDVLQINNKLRSFSVVEWEDSAAVRHAVRSTFRSNRDLKEEGEVSDAIDAGFLALRSLNTYYQDHINSLRELRAEHEDRAGVDFAVGQVFVHKKFDYRGVIFGWDRVCEREPGWADALRINPDQPFYKVLPDEDDCQMAFGSIRITKYVAQENVKAVTTPRRVTNRALENYFSAYSPSNMRYIPNRQLSFEYPDEYDATDAVSCREDTNILRVNDVSSDDSSDDPFLKFGWRHPNDAR